LRRLNFAPGNAVAPKFSASPGSTIDQIFARRRTMPYVEERQFRYPAEDECLVRRLGAGVIAAWPHLPPEARDLIFSEAKIAWDREHFVSKLGAKLEAILRRGQS
jgi:hypothetical protein